jgi:hypothetical protein
MNEPIQHAAPKVVAAASLVFAGFTVSEWAALMAFIYSTLLVGEWLWKKLFKRLAISYGWITSKEPE